MDLPVNTFKRAIKAGKQQIGLWSSLSSNITVEVIAGSGFDWILIDTEHSPNELPMVLSQLQAAVGGTAHPIVRPAWNDTVLIKRFLDAGVQSFRGGPSSWRRSSRAAESDRAYPDRGIPAAVPASGRTAWRVDPAGRVPAGRPAAAGT